MFRRSVCRPTAWEWSAPNHSHAHNLSTARGRRQLFCVARALVRKPRILVLDESTADLDQESANELLRVIDDNFHDTTVRTPPAG